MNDDTAVAEKPVTFSLRTITHAIFAECVGDPFRLDLGNGKEATLTLTSVADLSAGTSGMTELGNRVPFSLIFRLSDRSYLPQHTYRLIHSKLGALDIFLVPIGPDEKGMQFEAIFN